MSKIVLITGASSGIGKAIALRCASEGHPVLICARRQNKLEELCAQIKQTYGTPVHAFPLDVSDLDQVHRSLKNLPQDWSRIEVLVNNAGGAYGLDSFVDSDLQDWDQMIDVNVKGLLYVSQFVVKGMLERNCGHLIQIGSISGHDVYAKGTVYCATKHAVRAINNGLKKELHGTPLRVTSIDPGLVETDFSLVRFKQDKEKAKAVYEGANALQAADVADAVYYCLSRPAHVNIQELLITPTSQSSVSLVHRDP